MSMHWSSKGIEELQALLLARAGDLDRRMAEFGEVGSPPAIGIAVRDVDWPTYWVIRLVDETNVWIEDEEVRSALGMLLGRTLNRCTPGSKLEWVYEGGAANAGVAWLTLTAGELLTTALARIEPRSTWFGLPAGLELRLRGLSGIQLFCTRCPADQQVLLDWDEAEASQDDWPESKLPLQPVLDRALDHQREVGHAWR